VKSTRSIRRLLPDTEGQVLLFGAALVVVILAFLLVIPNGTQVVTQKVRAQTAADVGAFSGAVWLARALNLNASMNVGIKSIYTWATVLTVGSALAQALYADTAKSDTGAQEMGQALVTALFNTANPPPVVTNVEYPAAIGALNTTMHWLHDLQDDITESFHDMAAQLGTNEACANMGVSSPSQTAGGWVLVRSDDTTDTTPLLGGESAGVSLTYLELGQVADSLESLPTGSNTIGPAVGIIRVDPDSLDIWAYYGFWSQYAWVRQVVAHYYKKPVIQAFQNKTTGAIDTAIEYFDKPGGTRYIAYLQGDSWATWLSTCGESDTHTPIIWPNGESTPPYKNEVSWTLLNCHPGDNRYKIDTVWVDRLHVPKGTPAYDSWSFQWPDSGYLLDSLKDGQFVDTSSIWTEFYTGADSTVAHSFDRVPPRRPNPDREFHAVSYVWRQGASTSPYGLGAPMGGRLFPRTSVAPPSPLFTVARSVPHVVKAGATDYDFYFTSAWDARLTPFDSVGVLEIASDTANGGYYVHTRSSFGNLEDLRKYVLLP